MKKIKITLFSMFLAMGLFAQNTNSIKKIATGEGTEVRNALNIYVGPSFVNGFGGIVMADFEIKMFNDNLTIGPSIGVGVASYPYSYKVDNGFGGTTYATGFKTSVIIAPAVVGHYYFDWLIPNMHARYDVFAKAKAGVLLATDKSIDPFFPVDIAIKAGGRINMTNNFSFYGTVGYGHSYVNVGISIKM
jgi:hypothetical protein